MNDKKNYLFTLTITPVQSFITQARKTKDLFAGSEILSNLMRKTLESLDKEEIIFPQSDEFVSNKILLKLEDKTKEDIEKIGNKLEEDINNAFIDDIFKNTYKYDKAFRNFFKVFWVAVELGDGYKKSYKKLEQNLGAIKNLRIFRQLEQKGGRKCSICGERNGVFYNYDKKPKYIIKNAVGIKNNQIKEGESLCAVCFTKRFYNDNSYPSTAKIALLDWLKRVENKDKYKELFKKPFDESLYFKDNLSKEYLKKWGYFNGDDNLEKAIEFLDNLKNDIKQKKYYALIQFDIDDMGKKLSSLDKKGQIELSNKLANFATKAKNIVDKSGKTIYAGGDDFLGFVNLKYLFEVIEEIKKSFTDEVKTSFPNLTYSIAIIISHYKEPLHIVLNRVRRIEKMAKEIDENKNGLAISVLKHSGEIIESRVKNTTENIQNLAQIIKLVEDDFSDKFIINLELEFRSLIDESDRLLVKKELLQVELKRLIKKSLINKEQKEKIDELFGVLTHFIEHRKMSNFFHLLNIIRSIKRGLK